MKQIRTTLFVAACCLITLKIVQAQEMPLYEIAAGIQPITSESNTAAGNVLIDYWDNSSYNTFKVSDYLIASESNQLHADSLSGAGIPIGFNFPYAGRAFDIFGVSAQGFIVLGKKETGIKIFADTLKYGEDTSFTDRNSYLISGLMMGKNTDKVYAINISFKQYGFPGKRNIVINFRKRISKLGTNNYFLYVINNSSIILYEDGKIDITYNCEYLFAENADFVTEGFFVQKYGHTDKRLWIYENADNGFDWNQPAYHYSESPNYGIINEGYYPQAIPSGSPTLTFTPDPFPLSPVRPFTWDLQGRQGKLSGYYDKDHSFLKDDTISTTSTVWWYAPQYVPTTYDVYLGTDTLSMALIRAGTTGDFVNPRNGFQKVPLASVKLDSLAPETRYFLKIISRDTADSLVSYTSFYTDSIEAAFDYCTNIGTESFWVGALGDIRFNEMAFVNPSVMWDRHLVPDTVSWTTTLTRGETYSLSIKARPDAEVTLFNVKTYIDFNHNGEFENHEGFFARQIISENRYEVIYIPIPRNAYIGKTRMRFVLGYVQNNENIPPCSSMSYLDFTVSIIQPDSCNDLSYTIEASPACFGNQNGSLTLFPTGGKPPYKIQWNTGNPADTLPVLDGLQVNARHRAALSDARGCNLRSAMTVVTQSSPVLLDTSIITQQKLIFKGGTAPYEITIVGAAIIQTEDTLEITTLEDGHYNITVTDANACTYEPGEINILRTGYMKARVKEILLYPNPAKKVTYVQGVKNFTADIYNSNGILVRQTEDVGTGLIPLTGLDPGLYLIWIRKDSEVFQQKLMVN